MNSSSSGSGGNFRGPPRSSSFKPNNTNRGSFGGQGGSYNRGYQSGGNYPPRSQPAAAPAAGTESSATPVTGAGTSPAQTTPQAGGYNRRPGGFGGGSGGFSRGPGNYQRRDYASKREGPPEAHRINGRITAREVRVVSESGEQLGVLSTSEAWSIAQRDGLDLVEVAPQAKPPVCKIMDYGKFKYREQKKEAEARKKRTESTLKELRIRYRTDSGDLETKLKQAKEFLADGDKVKFSMRFKGREAAFMDLGVQKFNMIVERLAEIASVDERSPTSGKQIHITFAPLKLSTPVKQKKHPAGSSDNAAGGKVVASAGAPAATNMGQILSAAVTARTEKE